MKEKVGRPARKAGVQEFDIILECNGEKITQNKPLEDILRQLETGNELKLKVWRQEKEMLLKTVLGEKN